jgi:hypothetical protein
VSYTIRRFVALRPVAVVTLDYLFVNVLTQTTANLTVESW